MNQTATALNRSLLEKAYALYHKRCFVHPDPLEFLYRYSDPLDVEIVGLLASCLAYGRVKQILSSVEKVVSVMLPTPRIFIEQSSERIFRRTFSMFRHRFTTGDELARLLGAIKEQLTRHGSLEGLFLTFYKAEHETLLPALDGFVEQLVSGNRSSLLPLPSKGSACKRLHLFLRWMIRKDEVDPGCWASLPAEKLVIPLDTHMHDIALRLGFTTRKQADARSALEVTRAFALFSPEDPVKYDFCLTRLGIRDELDKDEFLAGFRGTAQSINRY